MKNKKRLLAWILLLAMSMGMFQGVPQVRAFQTVSSETKEIEAAEEGSRVYEGEDYIICVREQSSWDGGSVAEVLIKNTGEKQIRNWILSAQYEKGRIENIWNADIKNAEKSSYKLYCKDFNRAIQPGEEVCLGYQMSDAGLQDLVSVGLSQKKETVKQTEYYSVFYRIAETWDGYANIEAQIINLTDRDIEDWKLTFTLNGEIENIWKARAYKTAQGHYTIENDDYNAVIRAESQVSFGFLVNFYTDEIACPQESCVSGVEEEDSQDPVPTGAPTVTPAVTEQPTAEPTKEPTAEPTIEPTAQPVQEDSDDDEIPVYHDIENIDWNMDMIHAGAQSVQKVRDNPKGRIRVALLDSGVNYSDEVDVTERKDFLLDDGEDEEEDDEVTIFYEDVSGHGTAIAEIMASNPYERPVFVNDSDKEKEPECTDLSTLFTQAEDQQTDSFWEEEKVNQEEEDTVSLADLCDSGYPWIEGINPNMDLISARVLDENNEATVERVVRAIDWAIESDANIIHMSFGIDKSSKALLDAVKRAYKKGILLIASASNDSQKVYPAAYREVMSVGAVDSMGEVSDEVSDNNGVEVVAPGDCIISRGAFDSREIFSGTSMAAAHVTGLASLLWQEKSDQTADYIRQLIRETAKDCGDPGRYGSGLIDCDYALAKMDEFEQAYEKNEEFTGENDEEIETDETIGTICGKWGVKKHEGFVSKNKNIENLKDVKEAYYEILKKASACPDEKENKKCKGMSLHPWFHGFYDLQKETTETQSDKKSKKKTYVHDKYCDYVESVRYLYRLATAQYDGEMKKVQNKALKESGLKEDQKTAREGINLAISDEKVGSLPWRKIHPECEPKRKYRERSLVLVGMALHCLTDTYSHSSYYCDPDSTDKISWKRAKHKINSKGIVVKGDADNVNFRAYRYKDAKAAAKKLLSHVKLDEKLEFKLDKYDDNFVGNLYFAPEYKCRLSQYYKKTFNGDRMIEKSYFEKAYVLRRFYQYLNECGGLKENGKQNADNVKNGTLYLCDSAQNDYTNENLTGIISENHSVEYRETMENGKKKVSVTVNGMDEDNVYVFLVRKDIYDEDRTKENQNDLADSGVFVRLYRNQSETPLLEQSVPKKAGYCWEPLYIVGETAGIYRTDYMTDDILVQAGEGEYYEQ